jgi:hypothetical protein
MTAIVGTVAGKNSIAVTGTATGENSVGVMGKGDTNGIQTVGGANGVFATGKSWCGVVGISESTTGGFGVYGENTAGGTGVVGKSKGWHAVAGFSSSTTGGFGVYGEAVGAGCRRRQHDLDGYVRRNPKHNRRRGCLGRA